MKPIELKLKIYSRTWLTPVLIIFAMFFAMAMVSPVIAAAPDLCDPLGFCDQDGDGYFRDHNRCLGACVGEIDCDDNDDSIPDPNPCDGGGGDSDYIQHNKSVRVIWGAEVSHFGDPLGLPYETAQNGTQKMRLCGPGIEDPDPIIPTHPMVDIKFICHANADFLYGRLGYWNTVYLDFSDLTLESSGKDPALALDLCDRLVQGDYFPMEIVPKAEADCENPPDRYCVDGDPDDPVNVGRLSMYHFVLDESNTEPCIWGSNPDNRCKVRLFTQGYFYNECSGPKCGRRIGMEAYGRVDPAGAPNDYPIEINPFTEDREIVIEELNVFFMGIGKNRTEANCYFNNVIDGGYLNADLVFRTCVDVNLNGLCDSAEPQ